MITVSRTTDPDFPEVFARIVQRDSSSDAAEIQNDVRAIVDNVARRGDEAVLEYSIRFDDRPGMTAAELEVDPAALDEALFSLDPGVRQALERAAARIRAFHDVQRGSLADAVLDDGHGLRAELIVRPLEKAGVYVPGGTAAYPSTVLMNVIPAKVAGVQEVVMVTPAKGGRIIPAVLAAAKIAGADRVFSVGGAQAVAALAYGTVRIPRVDKIVGPGNAYVQEAKRQVFGRVAIDCIAGPSEVLIVADDSANARVVAADLLAQAEHDIRSAAVLVTWSAELAHHVAREVEEQCAELPRAHLAKAAIDARGGVIVARDRAEAFMLANRYAPEHMGLAIEDARKHAAEITAAGAVFIGHHTPEALGDYNAGVNHVLPTGATARFGSPLSVHDFVKRMNLLEIDSEALEAIGQDAARLARVEGLEAHARAIETRWRSN